ncbi:MAG: OmpA family protein [Flavobacterium sp.]|nr:OmpA family protein [Flavobacterium sp.]
MKKKYCICFLLIATFLSTHAQDKLTVFFDFDRYELNETAEKQLQIWRTENPKIEVSKIYGFCDWKGTNVYNDSLSLKRVKTIFDYLKSHQIHVKDGYEIKGFGEDFEQSKVQSENRKVLIVFEPKKEIGQPIGNDQPLSLQFQQAKSGDVIRLKNIYFYNMTPRILPKSRPVLIELLCALEDNPKLKIEIQGHICCQKVYDINELSVMRARAIYNYLVNQKINRKRLSYKGFGTSKPIYPIPEKSTFEQDENRRVEILVLEK